MKNGITRRGFVSGAVSSVAGVALLPNVLRGAEATVPVLRIGLAADAQYADVNPGGSRFYREGAPRLGAAIEEFNGLELDFCAHLGDLIDRTWRSFDEMVGVLGKARHKFHHVLGNHDFSVIDERKGEVPGRIGMEKRYYGVALKGFRFLFLDTTDVSTYAHPAGSEEFAAAKAEMKRVGPGAKSWSGAIGDGQMAWFVGELEAAKKAGEKVMVCSHHPIAPGHAIWNAAEVLEKIAGYDHIVGWFCGHNHAGAFVEVGGVPFVTMRGMVETKDTSSYGVMEVFEDRLVLTGRGREVSRELVFGG